MPYNFQVSPQQYWGTDDVSELPAGLRNNNPFNTIFVKSQQGKPGVLGPSENKDVGYPQTVFDSPQSGANYGVNLMLRKFDNGKNTVDSMIAGENGWTPGNHTAAANLAKTMGVSPTDQINLRDPNQLVAFQRALAIQEHGPQYGARLGDDVFKQAAAQALGTAPPAQALGPANTATGIQGATGSGITGFGMFGAAPQPNADAGVAAPAPQAQNFGVNGAVGAAPQGTGGNGLLGATPYVSSPYDNIATASTGGAGGQAQGQGQGQTGSANAGNSSAQNSGDATIQGLLGGIVKAAAILGSQGKPTYGTPQHLSPSFNKVEVAAPSMYGIGPLTGVRLPVKGILG